MRSIIGEYFHNCFGSRNPSVSSRRYRSLDEQRSSLVNTTIVTNITIYSHKNKTRLQRQTKNDSFNENDTRVNEQLQI